MSTNLDLLDQRELSEADLKMLRGQIAMARNKHRPAFDDMSLADQRAHLKRYVSGLLALNDFPEDAISYEDVSAMIEDFLFHNDLERAKDVHAETWTPWLTPTRKKSIKWDYSDRYFKYLTGPKGWKEDSASSIDQSTDEILNHCGDPCSSKDFEIKGLVVGDIQSGKTANYTALINKAIDAGYKIIIVLTGTTNDLRSQTQARLDKEVVGYKTDFKKDDEMSGSVIKDEDYGVAAISDLDRVQVLTNASIDGDLKRTMGLYQINGGSSCYLAVIKKNKASLNAIIRFLKGSLASKKDPDGKMPFPVLVIDDEADLASIGTADSQKLNATTGTNKLIRTILFKTCRKFTYIGYTATPFANVFIKPHDKNLSADDVDDIFPDDFIVTLPTPPDYCGPFQYFGINRNSKDNGESRISTDLLVPVDPADLKYFCDASKNAFVDSNYGCLRIPQSLRDAVMCFLIGCGIKISRGIIENYTMLVNVNVLVKFNTLLCENVKRVFNDCCKMFVNDPEVRSSYRDYWEKEMKPVSETRLGDAFHDVWDGENGIEKGILAAIKLRTDNTVKLISGTSPDRLDYSAKQGIYVCVGGQKLSRGLTLEGLSVSYYGRHTNAMDTLLQMGRWFGYRKGWLDVCRVFTSPDIANQYLDSAITTEGFKNQISLMHDQNATPRTFGLKVRAISQKMLPTSRNKMKNVQKISTSFSCALSQTLEFFSDKTESNLGNLNRFIASIREHYRPRKGFSAPVFRNVAAKDVLCFLEACSFPSSTNVLWQDYIRKCNKAGELVKWTVILSTNDEKGEGLKIGGEYDIVKANRSVPMGGSTTGTLKLRALTKPSDYVGFFPDGIEPRYKNGYEPDADPIIKRYYTPDNGILVIYVFDIHEASSQARKGVFGPLIKDGGESVTGLAIWFPKSNVFEPELAYANAVELERFYGDNGQTVK